jgi:hypothetical protein
LFCTDRNRKRESKDYKYISKFNTIEFNSKATGAGPARVIHQVELDFRIHSRSRATIVLVASASSSGRLRLGPCRHGKVSEKCCKNLVVFLFEFAVLNFSN